MAHGPHPVGPARLIEPGTARIQLRQWRAEDRAPFAALNADARVMEFFPAPLDARASDAMADRCEALIAERGWGFWAAESRESGRFMGFVGLHVPSPALPFSPCVEIGWRLASEYWGQGLATEAAHAALRVGFTQLGLDEIVSFTSVPNLRSRRVMKRLGMHPDVLTFEHPALPQGHHLREHCLYRLSRKRWQVAQGVTPAG